MNRVVRSRSLVTIVSLALLAVGCAPYTDQMVGDFDDSNQVLVEATVADLEVADVVAAAVPAGSRIALVSLERHESGDDQLQSMIEDVHIGTLIDRGFRVLERDGDMLRRLVAEADTAGHALYWFPERGWWSVEGRSSRVSGLSSSVPYSSSFGWSAGGSTTSMSGADTGIDPHRIESGLDQADYLISYRILEMGVLFGERNRREKTVDREARARLHVRIQSTEDGRIVHASDIMATRSDSVDRRLARRLMNFHYTPYGSGLPLSRSTEEFPTSKRVTVSGTHSGSSGSDQGQKVVAVVLLAGLVGAAIAVQN